MTVTIKGYVPSSLIDWPGRLCAIVFVGGCDFRCPYCHAAHLVCESGSLETIPVSNVLDHLTSRLGWIDGVTVSGGEPALQDGLEGFLRCLKDRGFAVKLDTNGSRPRVLEDLVGKGLVDFVALDVKAPLDERHERLSGVKGAERAVRESLGLLLSGSIPYELRTTVVPALLSEADLCDLARELRDARLWVLQGFRPQGCLDPELCKLPRVAVEVLRGWALKLRQIAPGVQVRGVSSGPDSFDGRAGFA